MTRPEAWLRRTAVVFACAAVIVTSIAVMVVVFDRVMPAP